MREPNYKKFYADRLLFPISGMELSFYVPGMVFSLVFTGPIIAIAGLFFPVTEETSAVKLFILFCVGVWCGNQLIWLGRRKKKGIE